MGGSINKDYLLGLLKRINGFILERVSCNKVKYVEEVNKIIVNIVINVESK